MDSTQRTRPRTGGSPVGLVVFIILTVLFAVLAYWAFAKFQTAQREIDTLQGKLNAAETNVKNANTVNKNWAEVTGAPSSDALKKFIKNTLDATRAENIGTELPDTASAALMAAPNTIVALKNVQEGLAAEVQTLTAQNKNLAEQKNAAEATLESELATKISDIQALEKKMADENARLQARIDEEVAARESLRDTYYTERDEWQKTETAFILHIGELKEKLRRLSGEGAIIERADAVITAIDRINDLVTINIGAEEGVEQQMRFVAFSRDAKSQPIRKGVIEIIRVSPKVSVARILTVEPDMAVGRGDSVYNLAGPPKKLFVFAGTPKIYNMVQWTNFIRANGGDMVESVQKGDQVADYLVTCEFDEEDPVATQKIFDARDFGLKIIKEEDLKEWLGLR